MRAFVAFALAVWIALGAAAPHVHPLGDPDSHCAVCVARHGGVARSETPDVAPSAFHAEPVAAAPGLAPVFGAPLGAIPGQSPPVGA